MRLLKYLNFRKSSKLILDKFGSKYKIIVSVLMKRNPYLDPSNDTYTITREFKNREDLKNFLRDIQFSDAFIKFTKYQMISY